MMITEQTYCLYFGMHFHKKILLGKDFWCSEAACVKRGQVSVENLIVYDLTYRPKCTLLSTQGSRHLKTDMKALYSRVQIENCKTVNKQQQSAKNHIFKQRI